MSTGKIIAAFGLPGSGKSTVTKEIGKLLKIDTLHEPEEKEWEKAVSDRAISGNFTAIMWFRSIRVPLIYEASIKKNNGEIVMLDSYYDKLFSLYMSKEGMEWLFQKNDNYCKEMKQIANKDYKLLPNIDCLVFFKIDMDTWLKFLLKRNRNLDNEIAFRKNCFNSQKHFLKAAKKYCHESNCKLIIFNQKYSSPQKAAKEVVQELEKINMAF